MHNRLRQELAAELRAERFDLTPEGVYFPRQSVLAAGEYFDRVNGGEWSRTPNLVVNEGMAHILNVALGATAKPTGYFLALFNGAATPQANWTAASFAATAGEIVSMSEGYTSPTRPAWTPGVAATNSIDNMAAVATVTIAATSQINVTGAAMLTSSVRGGTTGVLVSATRYASERTFQNGDTYDIGYRLSLTV